MLTKQEDLFQALSIILLQKANSKKLFLSKNVDNFNYFLKKQKSP